MPPMLQEEMRWHCKLYLAQADAAVLRAPASLWHRRNLPVSSQQQAPSSTWHAAKHAAIARPQPIHLCGVELIADS